MNEPRELRLVIPRTVEHVHWWDTHYEGMSVMVDVNGRDIFIDHGYELVVTSALQVDGGTLQPGVHRISRVAPDHTVETGENVFVYLECMQRLRLGELLKLLEGDTIRLRQRQSTAA